jgi:prophage maintenance system killer protein
MRTRGPRSSTLVFLGLNGHDFDRDDRRLDDAVLAVATGDMSREEVASLLREIAWAP